MRKKVGQLSAIEAKDPYAFVQRQYIRTFCLGVVQGKIEIRKITNLALRDGHANDFSVTEFSVIRNSRKVVVANAPLAVGGFAPGVSGSRRVLAGLPA